MSDEAQRAGLAMQPAHVLIFGSPKGGTPLMVAAPLLALDLPLKVLVWQDGAGKVWASYYAPSYLAARYGLTADLAKRYPRCRGGCGECHPRPSACMITVWITMLPAA